MRAFGICALLCRDLDMATLPELPFPVSELGWDKFDQLRAAVQLSNDDCMRLMTMVCGKPPPGFVPWRIFELKFSNLG